MFGFGFGFLTETPERRKIRIRREKEETARRMALAVDWEDDIKWERRLNIKGKSYKPKSLFKVKPSSQHPNDEENEACLILSPSKKFCYYERTLPKGSELFTAKGRYQGNVLFDSKVRIPALFERDFRQEDKVVWRDSPWMSYTPMEYITLRCGTRYAKGTVVVAGLGMGYQLEKVAARSKVKKIVLVEQSEELAEWIMPQLELNGHDVEVVIGDAKKLIPEMEADAALIDIYRGYGGNEFPRCPNINKVWVWGSQYAEH